MSCQPQENDARAKSLCTAQLLQLVEHVRKGTYALRIVARDEELDSFIGNSLDFIAESQEQELEVIAAGIRALCPA